MNTTTEPCKHPKINLVYAKGRCSECGYEIGRSTMKKLITDSIGKSYKQGYAEGYAKAMGETAKAQGPIDVPFEVKGQEVEDVPSATQAE